MKFSVLLPTRNGGGFLRNCIGSILEEPCQDMELIVSDNANTDQTQEVIRSFAGDSRLKVIRLDEPVNVTENWNLALAASSGDYFLMMGDDDCLLPGYFKRIEQLLERYSYPDCITYNAYTYIAPGAVNNNHRSFYNPQHFNFGPGFKEGLIDARRRFLIVRDMYRFRVGIPLNMQTTLVSCSVAKSIRGGIFQPPFPDHYALNALLLTAKQWVYYPDNLLIVGLSAKSFGHFVYSNQQEDGLSYLGISSSFEGRLPGNELINHMHVWLRLLKVNYQDYLAGIKISRPDYVRRQVYHWYMQYRLQAITFKEFKRRFSGLSLGDWIGLLVSLFDWQSWKRFLLMIKSRRKSNTQKIMQGLSPLEGILSISDFRDWVGKSQVGG